MLLNLSAPHSKKLHHALLQSVCTYALKIVLLNSAWCLPTWSMLKCRCYFSVPVPHKKWAATHSPRQSLNGCKTKHLSNECQIILHVSCALPRIQTLDKDKIQIIKWTRHLYALPHRRYAKFKHVPQDIISIRTMTKKGQKHGTRFAW